MPYILLVMGLLIGFYALYRFMLKASVEQVQALFLAAGALGIAAALFFLSVTGRFTAALGIIAASLPFFMGFLQSRKKHKQTQEGAQKDEGRSSVMDREEALRILGLEGQEPDTEEIKRAYKRLIKKVHPDIQGSEWMASKLNDAKDFLLKGKSQK